MMPKSYILRVILISLCCFFGGSALLFGITGGWRALLFSPILSVFGWFYYIVALVFVAFMWWLFTPTWSASSRALFIVGSAAVGALGMSLIGIYPIDESSIWRIAYIVSGGFSTGLSAFLVTILKK
jgi:hypothetical protein